MDSRKQQALVVIFTAAFLVLATITGTYLIKTGSLGGDVDDNGYKNVTYTDAVLTCESTVRERFNDRIITLVTDSHSSRFDDRFFLYKIFLKANMTSPKNEHGNMHFINCFVKSSDGRISKFEVLEESEAETEALTNQPSNAFGWPK